VSFLVPAGFRQASGGRWFERAWRRCLAEREGFEPSVPFDTHDFQSCTFDHSVTSPEICSAPGTAGASDSGESRLRHVCSSIGRALAERGGFEPPVACATLDFESSTFDHSDTSPGVTAIPANLARPEPASANLALANSIDRVDAGDSKHALLQAAPPARDAEAGCRS
jgi:hypothetical protein